MRFLGNIEARTDTKGRAFQQCLVLYPESVWNEQMDALRARLSRWNPTHQQIFRQFVSDVEMVTLDSSGRLLMPRRYLQMAGIEQDIKFIGMGDTIEVWSNERTQQPFMEAADFGKALEEIMGETATEATL